MSLRIAIEINGRTVDGTVEPRLLLADFIRDNAGLTGTKYGSGIAQCGACTVLVKGQAVRSCITAVEAVQGLEIITLEGLGTVDKPHPIQKAFIEEQAAQCGFCLNGVILTAKAFLDKNPKATEKEIQEGMSRVLCRCFTHTRMLRAIGRARQGMAR